jgi:putative tricarboxylic transport membrane protein
MLLWASIAILVLGLALTRPMLAVLRVPRALLMPVVFTLCVVGSFAIASRVFDIYVMLGFGLLGFALRLMHYPIAPLVLGIVLGEMLDRNFRRAMVLSDGNLEPLVTRPICAVLATLTLLVLLWDTPPFVRARAALLGRPR